MKGRYKDMSNEMKAKAMKAWEKGGYTYYLFKNICIPGYCIEKYDINGEHIDTIIGSTWYSLVYYFEHPETRYDNHKDF